MDSQERVSSTHQVEIVRVRPEKHPNADKLLVAKVFGYCCVMNTEEWAPRIKDGEVLCAYLPPDSLVDISQPEFTFLAEQAKAGKVRIKAKKLRGIISFGLLVPAPEGAKEGEDVAARLNVGHYEPVPEHEKRNGMKTGGEAASAPPVPAVKYDVDAFRRHSHLFTPGEPVVVTEKLDGSNSRYVYCDGQMHCGSHYEWKREYPTFDHITIENLLARGVPEERAKEVVEKVHSKPKQKNIFWDMLEKTPALEKFCRDNPGLVVYGEIYGNVNCIKYGLPDGNRFAAFDIMKDGKWLDFQVAYETAWQNDLDWVPVVSEKPFKYFVNGWPYDFDGVCAMAEGDTLVEGAKPKTIREGVVVRPLIERWDYRAGRIAFKCVSGTYLERYR